MNRPLVSSLALSLGLLVAACGEESSSDAEPAASSSSEKSHDEHEANESSGPESRLAVTHEGGVSVVRADSGEVLKTIPMTGFVRLNQAGDDRHLLVSTAKGFEALDLGVWTDAHGDHGHSFTGEPHLTGQVFAADAAGHAVAHHGQTTLFDDATGTILTFDPQELADGELKTVEKRTPEAHHGVAVTRDDGSLVHTVGNEEARNGIVVLDADGKEVTRSEKCPGVHGEAFAGEVAAFGCEDGVLLLDGDTVTKVQSPDSYGRIGNLFGHEESPVLLGDYKVDADAELERPTRVSLVDSATGKLRLVDLPASYSFRSLARGAEGEGLVLGTDGALRIIDPVRGVVAKTVDVVEAWREPTEWQEPRPSVAVVGDIAWVSEPATRELHAVDIARGAVVTSWTLDVVPNELAGVTG